MKDKTTLIDLGHCVARLIDRGERGTPTLMILSPSYGEDGVHFPSQEICVAGASALLALADALAPYRSFDAAAK